MIADLIIPFHNRADMLIPCVRALAVGPEEAKLLIVDDGSDDAERRLAHSALEDCRIPLEWMQTHERLGFVGAVNFAWPRCKEAVTLVLNSDTVPPLGLVSTLVWALEFDARTAAVGPVSDNPCDLYQYRSAQPAATYDHHRGASVVVPYLTAMCLALKRKAITGLPFDLSFSPGYFEDLDLSCRLRAAGWQLRVVEACRVHHSGRASFGLDPHLGATISRNYRRFAARWSHLPEHQDLLIRLGLVGNPREVLA